MQTHWFYTVWPFIGVGGAIVMVVILLMTDTFRGNTTVSRWRDPVWLAWLAVPLYWVHQFEEYSLPVLGFDYSIQEMICEKIGFPPYPDCPIPLAFYPVVNIALMWFGAPLAAYLCRRNVLIGLSFWGLLFANGLVHTAGGVAVTNATAPTTSGTTAFWTPSASLVWTTVTLATAFDAVLIYNDTAAGKNAVSVHTFGSQTVTAGNFTLTMPANDATNALLRLAA